MSTKLQTMGYGSTVVAVNTNRAFAPGTSVVTLSSIFGDNIEFIQAAQSYRYLKIKVLSIIAKAQQKEASIGMLQNYVLVTWTDDTSEQVQQDDSAKTTPCYLIKAKAYHFRPPNATMPLYGSGNQITQYNPREFVICQDIKTETGYALPGRIIFDIAAVSYYTMELKCEFRGRKIMGAEELKLLATIVEKKEKEEAERVAKEKEMVLKEELKLEVQKELFKSQHKSEVEKELLNKD